MEYTGAVALLASRIAYLPLSPCLTNRNGRLSVRRSVQSLLMPPIITTGPCCKSLRLVRVVCRSTGVRPAKVIAELIFVAATASEYGTTPSCPAATEGPPLIPERRVAASVSASRMQTITVEGCSPPNCQKLVTVSARYLVATPNAMAAMSPRIISAKTQTTSTGLRALEGSDSVGLIFVSLEGLMDAFGGVSVSVRSEPRATRALGH